MFKRFWWVFLAMIPVGLIVGLFVAAVITYVMPKQYESEAVIELKPLPGDSASSMTPQFFGNEFEKIKSRNSLGKVVDNLALVEKWGLDKEAVIQILKGIVTAQNIRGTDLISIRVRHTNKEDARDIAAEVGRAYKIYRAEADSIVVHEEPQIAQSPVSPNVSLNLTLGTALGFLLSFPLSLLVILLSNRLIPAKAVV